MFLYAGNRLPGFFVLLPTLGTALLIWAAKSRVNTLFLSARPMVFIGKISYSWYLWHWPLFYLYKSLNGSEGGLPFLALIAVSLGLAILSWKFIEQPFRRQASHPGPTLARYAALASVITAAGLTLFIADGWPSRAPHKAQGFIEQARASVNPCLADLGVQTIQAGPDCVQNAVTGHSRLALLGDSHASALASGFKELAAGERFGFVEMTKSSCLPLWGFARASPELPGHWAQCMAYQQSAFSYLATQPDIKTVVLAGYWSTGTAIRRMPLEGAWDGRGDTSLLEALHSTISRLEALGIRVLLVQDVPSFTFDPFVTATADVMPIRSALSSVFNPESHKDATASSQFVNKDLSRPIIASVANRHPDVKLIDPWLTLCSPNNCRFGSKNQIYYLDPQHLTASGARAALRGHGTFAAPPAAKHRLR
jgi:hypothetical protein